MVPSNVSRPLAAVFALLLVTTGGMTGIAMATDHSTDAPTESAFAPDTDDPAPNETEVVSDLRERITSLESVTMTVRSTSVVDGEKTNTTERIWADLDDGQLRREVVESAFQENVTTVRNETTRIIYHEDQNSVQRMDTRLDTVLPSVQNLANESAIEYDYRGDRQLDGETVHELAANPTQAAASANISATLYVDADTDFPAQLVVTVSGNQTTYTTTTTYENVTLNPDIPESRFDIDIPENATEPGSNIEVNRYDEFDALQSAAEVTVPEPDVPAGFDFERGRTVDSRFYNTVSSTYTNETTDFTLTTSASESMFNYSQMDYEEVQLDNTTAWYNSYEDFSVLHWNCDGHAHTIYGDLSKQTVVDIAASVSYS